jgi:hypothetical protein
MRRDCFVVFGVFYDASLIGLDKCFELPGKTSRNDSACLESADDHEWPVLGRASSAQAAERKDVHGTRCRDGGIRSGGIEPAGGKVGLCSSEKLPGLRQGVRHAAAGAWVVLLRGPGIRGANGPRWCSRPDLWAVVRRRFAHCGTVAHVSEKSLSHRYNAAENSQVSTQIRAALIALFLDPQPSGLRFA